MNTYHEKQMDLDTVTRMHRSHFAMGGCREKTTTRVSELYNSMNQQDTAHSLIIKSMLVELDHGSIARKKNKL